MPLPELGRRKDSLASDFPLRGTGKSDKGIHQRARWFMHMPPACADMIRILPPGKKEDHPLGGLLFWQRRKDSNPHKRSQRQIVENRKDLQRKHYKIFVDQVAQVLAQTGVKMHRFLCRPAPYQGQVLAPLKLPVLFP